jgi:hypothetical protein
MERLTEERMKVLSSIGFVWDVVSVECSVSMVLLPLQTGQIVLLPLQTGQII